MELSSVLEEESVLLNIDDGFGQAQGRAELQDRSQLSYPMKMGHLPSKTLSLDCYVSEK